MGQETKILQYIKHFVKFGHVDFEICEQTN